MNKTKTGRTVKLVPTLHMASVYALLSEFPGTGLVTAAHLTMLKTLLADASRGRYGRDMAVGICDAARYSIGSRMPAKSLDSVFWKLLDTYLPLQFMRFQKILNFPKEHDFEERVIISEFAQINDIICK